MPSSPDRATANFVWKPLTRDGGAKLGRSAALYDLTGPRSDRTLRYESAPPLMESGFVVDVGDRTLRFESAPPPNHATIPADRRDAWSPPPAGPEPYLRVSPKPAAEQWTREASYEHRLEEALYRQEFRNIRIAYDGSQRLTIREPLKTSFPRKRESRKCLIRLDPRPPIEAFGGKLRGGDEI